MSAAGVVEAVLGTVAVYAVTVIVGLACAEAAAARQELRRRWERDA